QRDKNFYQRYVLLRNSYLKLSEQRQPDKTTAEKESPLLEKHYNNFVARYGTLNRSSNKRRVLKDTAFGFLVLSSLERKEGERFVKADILSSIVGLSEKPVMTDQPDDWIARSLDEKGKVDIRFIADAT